jgi:anti-sigma B factor antagonist
VEPTGFEIAEETRGVTLILSVLGALDVNTAPPLAHRVKEELDESLTALTLDLSDLTFMDPSGLRLLIELGQRADKGGWTLMLIPSTHDSAKKVLRMTGADRALPFGDPGSR